MESYHLRGTTRDSPDPPETLAILRTWRSRLTTIHCDGIRHTVLVSVIVLQAKPGRNPRDDPSTTPILTHRE